MALLIIPVDYTVAARSGMIELPSNVADIGNDLEDVPSSSVLTRDTPLRNTVTRARTIK